MKIRYIHARRSAHTSLLKKAGKNTVADFDAWPTGLRSTKQFERSIGAAAYEHRIVEQQAMATWTGHYKP
jgi:hypothetical protein